MDRQARDGFRGWRAKHRGEPELKRLADPPIGMGDFAKLATQTDLAKASKPALAATGERLARVGGGQRQRDRPANPSTRRLTTKFLSAEVVMPFMDGGVARVRATVKPASTTSSPTGG